MKITFSVKGLNQLKLLNAFTKEGIAISDLDRPSNKLMSFSLHEKDKQKAVHFIEKQGFEYEIIAQKGLRQSLKSFLPRIGLLIGIILTSVLSALAARFLWKIEITGNDRVDSLTVIRALKDNGISVGKKKSFSKEIVEETLLEIDDISAVSAQIVGTTLKINIVESALVSLPEETGDIVSLYDAEITRIIVDSGTAVVNIGDRVPIGRKLIEGIEYSTAGEQLSTVNASGKVYGKVNFTYSEIASLSGGYKRTGKIKKNTILKFFGLSIGKNVQSMSGYESETSVTRIGSFLPLYAETTYFYELEPLPPVDIEELKSSVADKAINDLVIKAGGSAVSANVNAISIDDNVFKVTVHIEAEISIGGRID